VTSKPCEQCAHALAPLPGSSTPSCLLLYPFPPGRDLLPLGVRAAHQAYHREQIRKNPSPAPRPCPHRKEAV